MIAERAGVTPSTVYRRWGDLAQLLADAAAERLRPVSDPDDTGSLAGDLSAFVLQYAEEMSSQVGRALLRDVLAEKNPTSPPCVVARTRPSICKPSTTALSSEARLVSRSTKRSTS